MCLPESPSPLPLSVLHAPIPIAVRGVVYVLCTILCCAVLCCPVLSCAVLWGVGVPGDAHSSSGDVVGRLGPVGPAGVQPTSALTVTVVHTERYKFSYGTVLVEDTATRQLHKFCVEFDDGALVRGPVRPL